MAKAERATEFNDIVITDFADEGAPGVKKYSCSKSGEGYNWVLVKNDETDVTLVEDVKYPKFDGLSFVAPHEGDSYKMEVGSSRRVKTRDDQGIPFWLLPQNDLHFPTFLGRGVPCRASH